MSKQPVWSWTDAVVAADVPSLTKLVCLNIARYLSSAGKGWRISIEQMVEDTGLSDRATRLHLKKAAAAGLIAIKREYNHLGHRAITQYIPRFPDGVELSKEPASLPAPDAARDLDGLPAPRTGRLPAPDAGQVSSQKARAKKRAGKGRRKKATKAKISVPARFYDDHKVAAEKSADAYRKAHKVEIPQDALGKWRDVFRRDFVEPHVDPADATEREKLISSIGRLEDIKARVEGEMNEALLAGKKKRASERAAYVIFIDSQIAHQEGALEALREKVPA